MAEPVLKHANYDRELTDRELRLVAVWRDPKHRRAELASLIWRRDMSLYVAMLSSLLLVGATIVGLVSVVQWLTGHPAWLPFWESSVFFAGMFIYYYASSAWATLAMLQRQVTAIKYIGQLEGQILG